MMKTGCRERATRRGAGASNGGVNSGAGSGATRLTKAALLLHFDDLVRSASVLRNNSASAERALARVAAEARESARLAEERAESLRRELEEARMEQRRSQAQLMQARADLEEEQQRRRRCEAGARELQARLRGLCTDASQLGVAASGVLDAAYIDDIVGFGGNRGVGGGRNVVGANGGIGEEHSSGDLLDPDDFDYDNTDEEAAAAANVAPSYSHRRGSPPAPVSSAAAFTATPTTSTAAPSRWSPPPPTVPQLVVDCVREIERRGLREVGLYRVSGSQKQVRQLWDAYSQSQQRKVPDLSGVEDVHVLCGLLKMYLSSLPEPLLTYRMWPDFARAAETANNELASATLLSLPPANRDTLVYLLAHLLRVADSPAVQMTESNLSRTLAPSLVGNSCHDPEPMMTINETAVQQSILRQLLCLPSNYYADLLASASSGDGSLLGGGGQPDGGGQQQSSYIASKTPLLRPRFKAAPVGDLRDPNFKEKVNLMRETYRATRKLFFPHPK
uniref:Rho-GAP domain-containing protein n=3 Tax=Macrostomum lignano TaxID=282301 RepID=A0A1I8IG08_9PLAT